jgi:hypothetical protein
MFGLQTCPFHQAFPLSKHKILSSSLSKTELVGDEWRRRPELLRRGGRPESRRVGAFFLIFFFRTAPLVLLYSNSTSISYKTWLINLDLALKIQKVWETKMNKREIDSLPSLDLFFHVSASGLMTRFHHLYYWCFYSVPSSFLCCGSGSDCSSSSLLEAYAFAACSQFLDLSFIDVMTLWNDCSLIWLRDSNSEAAIPSPFVYIVSLGSVSFCFLLKCSKHSDGDLGFKGNRNFVLVKGCRDLWNGCVCVVIRLNKTWWYWRVMLMDFWWVLCGYCYEWIWE